MDVLVLIDKLDDLVHNAKQVPLTDQVRVDKEEIYDLLDQMRATIPEEIKQARWIVKERQEMLAEAKREAERIVKEGRERQERLIADEEIVKAAERAAEDIIEDARAPVSARSASAPRTTPTRSSTRSRPTSRSSSPRSSAGASACRAATSRPESPSRTAAANAPRCLGSFRSQRGPTCLDTRRETARRLADDAAHGLGLVAPGVLRLDRPDKLPRVGLLLLKRWGPTPASGYAISAMRDPHRPAIHDDRGTISFASCTRRPTRSRAACARLGVARATGSRSSAATTPASSSRPSPRRSSARRCCC
jgi:cell division septum initiation protein DivIVA